MLIVSSSGMSHLLIGLGYEAGDAAMPVQKVLELLVADDKPLCLSQSILPCILPVNQQALEHLNAAHKNQCSSKLYNGTKWNLRSH